MDILSFRVNTTLEWMPKHLVYDKSTLVQAIAWWTGEKVITEANGIHNICHHYTCDVNMAQSTYGANMPQ